MLQYSSRKLARVSENSLKNSNGRGYLGVCVRLPPATNSSLCPHVPAPAPHQSLAFKRGKLSLLSAHKYWGKTLQGIPYKCTDLQSLESKHWPDCLRNSFTKPSGLEALDLKETAVWLSKHAGDDCKSFQQLIYHHLHLCSTNIVGTEEIWTNHKCICKYFEKNLSFNSFWQFLNPFHVSSETQVTCYHALILSS